MRICVSNIYSWWYFFHLQRMNPLTLVLAYYDAFSQVVIRPHSMKSLHCFMTLHPFLWITRVHFSSQCRRRSEGTISFIRRQKSSTVLAVSLKRSDWCETRPPLEVANRLCLIHLMLNSNKHREEGQKMRENMKERAENIHFNANKRYNTAYLNLVKA